MSAPGRLLTVKFLGAIPNSTLVVKRNRKPAKNLKTVVGIRNRKHLPLPLQNHSNKDELQELFEQLPEILFSLVVQ